MKVPANWLVVRGRLFFSSYAPLAAIVAARVVPSWPWVAAFTIFAVGGILNGWWLIKGGRKRSSSREVIENVSDQSAAASAYLATYLLPFLGSKPENAGDIFAYFIYFLAAFIIYIRSDLAVINPGLYIIGYKATKCDVNGKSSLILHKGELKKGEKVEVSSFMDVLIAR